jgi:hypothetical protein
VNAKGHVHGRLELPCTSQCWKDGANLGLSMSSFNGLDVDVDDPGAGTSQLVLPNIMASEHGLLSISLTF